MEILLALTSLLGLAAIAQGKRWGWLLATLASLGYVWFLWEINLPGQACLNLVYALSQIWGWQDEPSFSSQPHNCRYWLLVPWLALALGHWLSPVDASLTAAALITQLLTAQKVSQVWRAWVVIDLISSALYLSLDAYATSLLYLILAIIAERAHQTWNGKDATN